MRSSARIHCHELCCDVAFDRNPESEQVWRCAFAVQRDVRSLTDNVESNRAYPGPLQAHSSRATTPALSFVGGLHGAVVPVGPLAKAVDSAVAVEPGVGACAGTMLAVCASCCCSRRWRRSFALSLHSKQMAVIHPASPIEAFRI